MTTLARQLLLGISVIFFAALAGIAVIYVLNARLYLQQQLDSHAQDAATSLGLSLGGSAGATDRVFAETVINAAFDRGHYERIVLLAVNGEVLVQKDLPPTAAAVPAWFTRILPLNAPTATSLVTKGWQQLGRVSVTSHPRLAYEQLWRTGSATLGWLAFIYLLALVAMRLFVAGLLRPLGAIEATAAAIARRDFRRIDALPRTRELRVVVEAMNNLSGKVRETIEHESVRAEQLRRDAFLDPVTGVWNRRGLIQQFDARVRDERDVFSGTLLLVQLHELAEFNRQNGYERGDEALKVVCEAINEWSEPRQAVAGRWAGASFVGVVANAGSGEARTLAETLCRGLEARLAEHGMSQRLHFNCGVASFDEGKPEMGALLAAADGALTRAQQQGSGLFELARLEEGAAAEAGSLEWRQRIEACLDEERLAFYRQAAVALDGSLLHIEVMTRLVDENGETVPAMRFVPMAARHGLVQRLDRAMLERLLVRLRAGALDGAAVAVNISAYSAADDMFVNWVRAQLKADPALAGRLSFEMSEAGVMRSVELALSFAEVVRDAGARFAVDGFGIHRESLQLLQRLLPDYVKLAGSHAATLREEASSRFFVEAIVRIASSLDIPVLAHAVEDEALLPLLGELGIAGYQGFIGGAPAPLE